MMHAFDTPLLRRLAALAVLFCLLLLGSELFSGPISSMTGRAALIAQQDAVAAGLKSRVAAARAIAARGAVIFAATRDEAAQALTSYIAKSTPPQGWDVSELQIMPVRENAPGLVEVRLSARATATGLRMFLGALESGGTAVAMPAFDISTATPASEEEPPTPTIFAVRLMLTGLYAKGAGS